MAFSARERGGSGGGRGGFTLLEMMVALAVIATVAATVFMRGGETAAQLHALERRALARMVAENAVERSRLKRLATGVLAPVGTTRQRVTLGSREWVVAARTRRTSHGSLRRMDYEVFAVEEGREVGPIDQLSAFVGQR